MCQVAQNQASSGLHSGTALGQGPILQEALRQLPRPLGQRHDMQPPHARKVKRLWMVWRDEEGSAVCLWCGKETLLPRSRPACRASPAE